MHVMRNSATKSRRLRYNVKAIMPSLCIVKLHVTVNNINYFSVQNNAFTAFLRPWQKLKVLRSLCKVSDVNEI
jgi:hypothetical protein